MKKMRKLTKEERLKFDKDFKKKSNKKSKTTVKCTCGKGLPGSHWCEKCESFTGGLCTEVKSV